MKYVNHLEHSTCVFRYSIVMRNESTHRQYDLIVYAESMIELLKKLPSLICEESMDLSRIEIQMLQYDARHHMRQLKG